MTADERAEARRIMAIQASTLPEPGRDGGRDIGPRGAWERASGVRAGNRAHVGDLDPTPERTGMGVVDGRRRGRR